MKKLSLFFMIFFFMVSKVSYAADAETIVLAEENLTKLERSLQDIMTELNNIDRFISQATRMSGWYKSQVSTFQATLDASMKEAGSCKAMELEFETQAEETVLDQSVIDFHNKELEKCFTRIAESAIDEMQIETFFKKIKADTNKMEQLATAKVSVANSLNDSREATEAKIKFWRTMQEADAPPQMPEN